MRYIFFIIITLFLASCSIFDTSSLLVIKENDYPDYKWAIYNLKIYYTSGNISRIIFSNPSNDPFENSFYCGSFTIECNYINNSITSIIYRAAKTNSFREYNIELKNNNKFIIVDLRYSLEKDTDIHVLDIEYSPDIGNISVVPYFDAEDPLTHSIDHLEVHKNGNYYSLTFSNSPYPDKLLDLNTNSSYFQNAFSAFIK